MRLRINLPGPFSVSVGGRRRTAATPRKPYVSPSEHLARGRRNRDLGRYAKKLRAEGILK